MEFCQLRDQILMIANGLGLELKAWATTARQQSGRPQYQSQGLRTVGVLHSSAGILRIS